MSAPSSTNLLQNQNMGLNNPPFEVYYFVAKVSHLARNWPCFDWWHYTVKVGQVEQKRRQLLNFVKTDLQNSSFTETFVEHSWPVQKRWITQCFRGNFGDSLVSHFHRFESCLLCSSCLLRQYITPGFLMRLKMRELQVQFFLVTKLKKKLTKEV